MNVNFILPLSMVFGLVCYGIIIKWYFYPSLIKLPKNEALIPLIFPHCFRYVGLAFLLNGVTSVALDPRFANPAAYGDLLAAVLALVAILALKSNHKFAIPIVWIFNIEGTLDLLNAVFQGRRFIPDGHFGATYFIPAVVVPALLATHFFIFKVLLQKSKI